MSALYAVIQVVHETHNNYRMDEIRETFNVGLPFIFTDRQRAVREAEKKRKSGIPTFVKEFPFNPLDKRFEELKKRVRDDAEYIVHLETVIEELDAEVARLNSRPEEVEQA